MHRLDVGTSGLIVVAKTDHAHLNLAEQFESRSVTKAYTALVYGVVKEDSGKIEAPIGRDPRNRVKMAVTRDGRQATTLYRVVERFDEFTLLDVEIKTGRTHQIRVHLAHIKHPVVADSTYGAGRANSIKSAKLRGILIELRRNNTECPLGTARLLLNARRVRLLVEALDEGRMSEDRRLAGGVVEDLK